MKIKNRIKAAVTAAFLCITAFTTGISASAWVNPGNQGLANANYSDLDPPIGYAINTDSFAWRVNLYVSKNEDGKIKESDMIGNHLALVGSVLCTTSGFTSHSGTSYIQTNYTDISETRNTFSNTGRATSSSGEDIGGIEYTLPTLVEFSPLDGIYTDASGHKVAIADSGKITLFDGQYRFPARFKQINDYLTGDDAGKYTTEIIAELAKKNANFINHDLPKAINSKIKENMSAKAKNDPDTPTLDKAINKYILPYNPESPTKSEPMVEWAMVITPMIHFYADTAFYCSENSSSALKHSGCDIPYVSNSDFVALDAYWFAQSDVTSISLGKDGWYQGQTYNNSAMHINPNTGKEIGLLSRFLRDTSGAGKHYASAVASAAYSTETSSDPYLIIFFCL